MYGMMRLAIMGVPGAQGGATPFVPTDVDGLVLWLDASDADTLFQDAAGTTAAAADADPVGAWHDKSGNNNHVTQSTAELRPTLKLNIVNSRPVVRFDTHKLVAPAAPFDAFESDGQFVVAVIAQDNAGLDCIVVKGAYRPGLKTDASLHVAYANVTNNAAVVSTAAMTLDTFFIVGYTAAAPDGEGNGSVSVHLGGAADVTDTVAIGSFTSVLPLTIGDGSSSSPFDGDIAELLMYTPPPSESERIAAFAYLAAKYGIDVPNP